MLKKLVLFGLLAGDAMARLSGPAEEDALDLEVVVEGGERKLFPLLPGTKCPAGHRCHASKHRASRSVDKSRSGVVPLMSSIKDNMKNPLTVAEQNSFDNDLTTMVESNDYCTRRNALARAAGLAAGLTVSMVNSPVYAAQTASVNMGTDSGQLVFQPDKLKICVGDSVSWVIVKGGPHNVVFDEENIPAGVSSEAISMDGQLGEEGETFTQKFTVAGTYGYYCEPHRSAGMNALLTVA